MQNLTKNPNWNWRKDVICWHKPRNLYSTSNCCKLFVPDCIRRRCLCIELAREPQRRIYARPILHFQSERVDSKLLGVEEIMHWRGYIGICKYAELPRNAQTTSKSNTLSNLNDCIEVNCNYQNLTVHHLRYRRDTTFLDVIVEKIPYRNRKNFPEQFDIPVTEESTLTPENMKN